MTVVGVSGNPRPAPAFDGMVHRDQLAQAAPSSTIWWY